MGHTDWLCITCNFIIHGSKTHCSKCHSNRNDSLSKYNQTVSSDNKSEKMEYRKNIRTSDRFYDWICPECKMNIYGSKRWCAKCKIRNPHLPKEL